MENIDKNLIQEIDSNISNEESSLETMQGEQGDNESSESIAIEREEVEEKIKELELEKQKLIQDTTYFLNKLSEIVESSSSVQEQEKYMRDNKLLDLVPENVSNLIEENLIRYNFIDYKIAKVFLANDSLGKEIDLLRQQLNFSRTDIENEVLESNLKPLEIENNETLESSDYGDNEQINISEIVNQVQGLYIDSARKYLPEGELQNAVVDYYSDEERLSNELGNVFKNISPKEVQEKINNVAKMFGNKENFVSEVSNKIESLQSTTERKNGFIRRDKRILENPYATKEEYEIGSYKDSLESQVSDAVFSLGKKGYITFESGMDERPSSRDQFIGMYNKNISLDSHLVENMKNKGFDISIDIMDDRSQIRITPLIENISLSKWKEIWDEVSESLPNAKEEDLNNAQEWRYHKEFREFQDSLG